MIFDNITIYLKRIFKTGIILLLIPLSFSVLCILLADKLDKLYGIMAKWPAELLGLCGMTTTYNFHESLILFYLFIILMNIFAISYCAGTAVDVLKHDERNGMIQFYINQPFTKVQIFIIKTSEQDLEKDNKQQEIQECTCRNTADAYLVKKKDMQRKQKKTKKVVMCSMKMNYLIRQLC